MRKRTSRKKRAGSTKRKRSSIPESDVIHKRRKLDDKPSSKKSVRKMKTSGKSDKEYPTHPPPSKSAILLRYLSEEDRQAVHDEGIRQRSNSNEPISGEFVDGKQTIVIDFWKLDYEFLIPTLLESGKRLLKKVDPKQYSLMINDVKQVEKSKKKNLVQKYIEEFLSKIMKGVSLEIRIDTNLCYYPLNCREPREKNITVREYLGSKAFGGVRTTHGIHGFFTMNKDKDNSDYNYGSYGIWGIGEGGVRRKTGQGRVTEGAKNIFISYYGDNRQRTFEELFKTKDGGIRYIDCSKGVGTGAIPTAVEDAIPKDATCPEFEKSCLEDGLLYSRLGSLMGGFERGEEINIRGSGKIMGCVVDMHSLSKGDKIIPGDHRTGDRSFTEETRDIIATSLASDINTQLKREVESNIYKFYREIFLHIEGILSGDD